MASSETNSANGFANNINWNSTQIVAEYTLDDYPISDVQNVYIPGSIKNDRRFLLGGLGSGLWRNLTDAQNEFWMITDRGPNGKVFVDGLLRRTFPIPEFTPVLVRVRTQDKQIRIKQVIPLRGSSGQPISGLSNSQKEDENPYDFQAQTPLQYDPSGLDPEDLVRTAQGEFWLADEYRPSLVRVSPEGQILRRYIPQGGVLEGADYPIAANLPAIYAKRKLNRGFEGLALSPDQTTLFAILESPLANPATATSASSRNTRILAFDIATEKPVAEYIYQLEEVSSFDPAITQADMKVSGLVALNPDTLLVLEHTDAVARLYKICLSKATNILDSRWDEASTIPSLEMCQDITGLGVTVLPKSLVIDLTTLAGVPAKLEGLTVIDQNTIAIANDNDFGIGNFDRTGNNAGNNTKSKIIIIRLGNSLFI